MMWNVFNAKLNKKAQRLIPYRSNTRIFIFHQARLLATKNGEDVKVCAHHGVMVVASVNAVPLAGLLTKIGIAAGNADSGRSEVK